MSILTLYQPMTHMHHAFAVCDTHVQVSGARFYFSPLYHVSITLGMQHGQPFRELLNAGTTSLVHKNTCFVVHRHALVQARNKEVVTRTPSHVCTY